MFLFTLFLFTVSIDSNLGAWVPNVLTVRNTFLISSIRNFGQPVSIAEKFWLNPLQSQDLDEKENQNKLCDTSQMIPDKWLALDKFYHLAVSFSLVGSTYHLLANRLGVKESYSTTGTITGVFGLGIAKEVYDSSRPDDRFSYRDLIFDLLGIGLGYLVFIH